jgi:hypothetical protein
MTEKINPESVEKETVLDKDFFIDRLEYAKNNGFLNRLVLELGLGIELR